MSEVMSLDKLEEVYALLQDIAVAPVITDGVMRSMQQGIANAGGTDYVLEDGQPSNGWGRSTVTIPLGTVDPDKCIFTHSFTATSEPYDMDPEIVSVELQSTGIVIVVRDRGQDYDTSECHGVVQGSWQVIEFS